MHKPTPILPIPQKQNKQTLQQLSYSKSLIKSRFNKYKILIDNSKDRQNQGILQQIFQGFSYRSLVGDSGLKDSVSSGICRQSTVDSDVEEFGDFSSTDPSPPLQKCESSPIGTNNWPQPLPDLHHPQYLQQLHHLNQITPNLHHPSFNIKKQMENITILIKTTITAIHHVFGCALRVGDCRKKIKVFSSQCQEQLSVGFFVHGGWEKVRPDSWIEGIRPRGNFQANLDFPQILNQLDLILSKTSRYQLATSLTQQLSPHLYTKMRQNLFQVEARLLHCSNSLYQLWIAPEYPTFYYKYLRILRKEESVTKCQINTLIREFRELWEIGQPVTCSEIGRAVWEALHDGGK